MKSVVIGPDTGNIKAKLLVLSNCYLCFPFTKGNSKHTSTPNIVDELMEDLEASNEVPEQEMDCDDETSDPSWKPQQLQSEYDKAADDND